MTARLKSVVAAAGWFMTLAAVYLAAVASDGRDELLYAGVFAAAGTILVRALHRADHRAFAPTPRALGTIAVRALIGAFNDTLLLLGPRLFAQLARSANDGRFIRMKFDPGRENARDAGRVACTLWASSLTPNAIPLFIARGELVLHQLVARREPNANDAEFPV